MDPSKVILNRRQKIKALVSAVKKSVPWEEVVVVAVLLILFAAYWHIIPIPADEMNVLIFILLKIVTSALSAFISALALGFLLAMVDEHVVPFFRKIQQSYEEESMKLKKDLLDNVIDDEILK